MEHITRKIQNVADILDTGIEKERILNLIYNNFSSDRIRLQGFALNQRMVVIPEFKWLTFTYKKGSGRI